MSKKETVSTVQDIEALERKVHESARKSARALRKLTSRTDGLKLLYGLKFQQIGCDPLEKRRSLNLIEQLNQSFTYLVSLMGVAFLLERHPRAAPFTVNFGTSPGMDIVSNDGSVAAEAFAATRPDSNNKLKKDLLKVSSSKARYKYVFYCSPGTEPKAQRTGDVEVVSLRLG